MTMLIFSLFELSGMVKQNVVKQTFRYRYIEIKITLVLRNYCYLFDKTDSIFLIILVYPKADKYLKHRLLVFYLEKEDVI